MALLQMTSKGWYCSRAGLYLDPVRKVSRAVVSHAHSDHYVGGCEQYLCHPQTAAVIRLRTCSTAVFQTVEYGVPTIVNGVSFTLFPAGHVPGSAQVRIEYQGEVWCYSGDYKLAGDSLTVPWEVVPCHTFITESTFGLPLYVWPDGGEELQRMADWHKQNSLYGINSIVQAYALGKAQRLQHELINLYQIPVWIHPLIARVNAALRQEGSTVAKEDGVLGDDVPPSDVLILTPPSGMKERWVQALAEKSLAMASGWVMGRKRRMAGGVDAAFVISDHAGWNELNDAVLACGAEKVYVHHGFAEAFAYGLTLRGVDAVSVDRGEEV